MAAGQNFHKDLTDGDRYYEWSNGGSWVDVTTPLINKGWLLTAAHYSSGGLFTFARGTSGVAAMHSSQLAAGAIRNAQELGRV